MAEYESGVSIAKCENGYILTTTVACNGMYEIKGRMIATSVDEALKLAKDALETLEEQQLSRYAAVEKAKGGLC